MQALPSHTSGTLFHALAPRTAADRASLPVQAASVAFIAALTAAAAQFSVHLPFTQVPITFQPIIVLLGGLVLGSRLGAYSQCLYLAAGIVGLPVFAASAALPPGIFRLLGPTGGYLLAYPVAAFVVGMLAERGWDRRYWTSLAAMTSGLLVIFAGGVSWLAVGFTHSLPDAVSQGFLTFIGPDLVKLTIAAAILPQAWKLIRLR